MKVRLKVVDQKEYLDEKKQPKGYGVVFTTNFGERISAYVNPDETELLNKYALETVHILDLYAYKGSDGVARLGVRLERELNEVVF